MTQHFTRNTVSAPFYCSKCGKQTSHRIDSGRKGPCLDCMARYDAMPKAEKVEVVKQQDLFSEVNS
jgi:hypothetical protein